MQPERHWAALAAVELGLGMNLDTSQRTRNMSSISSKLQAWPCPGHLSCTCASAQVNHPHIVPLTERRLPQQQLRQHESGLPHDKAHVAQALLGVHPATCTRLRTVSRSDVNGLLWVGTTQLVDAGCPATVFNADQRTPGTCCMKFNVGPLGRQDNARVGRGYDACAADAKLHPTA